MINIYYNILLSREETPKYREMKKLNYKPLIYNDTVYYFKDDENFYNNAYKQIKFIN